MSNSQLHGKTFEYRIRTSSRFPGAAADPTAHTAEFDIAARFDTSANPMPTSVKVTCNKLVGLADARRFWALVDSFRMLVGVYSQIGGYKRVHTIYEFLITPAVLGALRGSVTHAEVVALHDGISLDKFERGDYRAARKWAAEQTRDLRGHSLVTLNRKIDSKDQRRFQCSVGLDTLKTVCPEAQQSVYRTDFGGVALPLEILSSVRERN